MSKFTIGLVAGIVATCLLTSTMAEPHAQGAPPPQTGSPATAATSSLATLQAQNAKLTEKVAELERRIAALEAQAKPAGPAVQAPGSGSPTAAALADVPLVLDDWDYHFVSGSGGNNYYHISITLRNMSTKGIKLIDASVQFTDLLDQHLYGIAVSPDTVIPPGAQKIDAGEYSINQFINAQTRMKDMAKGDVKAKLVVKRVVFSDNSIFQMK